ncbi:DNA cytosine methyltransferase [Ureibacillus sp. GCM10028918]|uniref:DNA cytosine methyltransferase n=1 Tax=Ureibacillus sp. GCM10028918 TaxID=3273429 RepID=UPI00361F4244
MRSKGTIFKLIDLFAGAGGLSNGFEQTGKFEVVGAVEINKEATQTYIHNHKNNPNIIIKPGNDEISDITKIDFKRFIEEKNIDNNEVVVIGGPPCQGFSNANRQKNYLISGNNQLVKEYARAIDEIRPIAFLMENVKTMNSEKHKFFVTEHKESSILAYSSEKHLMKLIKKTGDEVFWEEDEIFLMESENPNLANLVNDVFNSEEIQPMIFGDVHLSRLRSIVRNLKRNKLYNVSKSADVKEIENIIEELVRYRDKNNGLNELFLHIIENAMQVLEVLLAQENTDNNKQMAKLNDFIDINQFIRYLKELKEESIVYSSEPIVEEVNSGKLRVSVTVQSYNVVKYLKVFFKYLGYKIDPEVMLSSDFYTPQNRHRFMILGVKEDAIKNGAVAMPEKISSKELPYTVFDAIGDLEKIEPKKEVKHSVLEYQPATATRMQRYFRSDMKEDVIYNHINTASTALSRKRFEALKENNGKNFHSLSKELKEVTYTDASRTQNTVYLRLKYEEPSPTVINVRKSMWQHPNKPEALSIREAARLQSFKDDFVFLGTKDKQYQQIGNAVPPLLARAVAEQMLKILGEEPTKTIKSEFEN